MSGGRTRQPNDQNILTSLDSALRPLAHPGVFAVAWRWRYELGLATVLPAGAVALGLGLGTVALAAAGAALAAAGTALGLWPRGRRLLIARAWCVITPHRVRTACASAWIQTRNGKLPVVVYTTPQPFGERVVLWCRAGISAEDLAGAADLLIAACWAADVRITRSGRYAHLVTVDVIRRRHAYPVSAARKRATWPGG